MRIGETGLYIYKAPELRDEFEEVMRRDGIPFSYQKDAEGTERVVVPLTSRQFHLAVKDAICEKMFRELGSYVPVYSFETLTDSEKFVRLQMHYWGETDPKKAEEAPFHVLPGRDTELFEY